MCRASIGTAPFFLLTINKSKFLTCFQYIFRYLYKTYLYKKISMIKNFQPLIIWTIIWIIVWFIVAKLTVHSSVKQARNVILWDVNEKLAPALPGFPYDFKDMVFIWKWIDYLVFDWLASWHLKKIVLLEIKSWQSLLNRNESMVKNAVWNWLVSYEVFRVHT